MSSGKRMGRAWRSWIARRRKSKKPVARGRVRKMMRNAFREEIRSQRLGLERRERRRQINAGMGDK